MHVGILGGTGPLGRGLGLRLAAGGASVVIGSRDPVRAADVVDGLNDRWRDRGIKLRAAGNDEATAPETVVVATPWEAAVATVRPLASALGDKLVISVANALVRQGRQMHALLPSRGSVAAEIQAALPRSRIAAAGHHLPAGALEDLDRPLADDVLVCSDHSEATESTMELLASVEGLRPVDAGSLASAGPIEAFTAVLVTVNMRYGAHTSLRLTGLDHMEHM